jgi:hypothetical protein
MCLREFPPLVAVTVAVVVVVATFVLVLVVVRKTLVWRVLTEVTVVGEGRVYTVDVSYEVMVLVPLHVALLAALELATLPRPNAGEATAARRRRIREERMVKDED